MRTLYLIGGPMGIGKTTACHILKRRLPNSVFLDGDWCWDMNPFSVTDETKKMVLDNICYVLNNFKMCIRDRPYSVSSIWILVLLLSIDKSVVLIMLSAMRAESAEVAIALAGSAFSMVRVS